MRNDSAGVTRIRSILSETRDPVLLCWLLSEFEDGSREAVRHLCYDSNPKKHLDDDCKVKTGSRH